MSKFIISGFADEIDSSTDIQFKTIKSLNISYFEPRGIDGKNIADLSEEEARTLREKMDRYGVKASSVGSPVGKIDITDDFEPELEKLAHVAKTAKIIGTRNIRVFSFYIPDEKYEEYRTEVMKRLSAMAELAEKEKIHTPNAKTIEELVEGLNANADEFVKTRREYTVIRRSVAVTFSRQ